MTKDQFNHVMLMTSHFDKFMSMKYAAGAKEHGGNLWDLSVIQLLDNMLAEVADQWAYLMTLRLKLEVLCAKDPAILTFTSSTEFDRMLKVQFREELSRIGLGHLNTRFTSEV